MPLVDSMATLWKVTCSFLNRKSISGLCIFLKKIFHSYSLKSWNSWHSLKVSIQNCNWIHCKGVSKVTKLFYAMGVESEMENKSEQASTALCICWFFWYSHCLFRSKEAQTEVRPNWVNCVTKRFCSIYIVTFTFGVSGLGIKKE